MCTAVRLLEELYPVAVPLLPSSVESVNEGEWDLEELRRRKEEQEAEAEESDEEQLVGLGDKRAWDVNGG